MQVNQKVKKRYIAFLWDCYEQKTGNYKDTLAKHRVDGSLFTTLRNLGYITSVNHATFNWTGNILNNERVEQIIGLHIDKVRAYHAEYRKRKKEIKAQEEHNNDPKYEGEYVDFPPKMTEKEAIEFLKSKGYEIFRVERRQL